MADYYLIAELMVKADNVPPFVEAVKRFEVPGFGGIDPKFDYSLQLALRSGEFTYPGYARASNALLSLTDTLDGTRMVQYVNVWRIPTVLGLDLASLMISSATSKLYNDIDRLVERESQDLLVVVPWISGLQQQQPGAGDMFVRITRRFKSGDLAAYVLNTGALAPLVNGVRPLGIFQNVTGPLNTITEFWQTTKNIAGQQGGLLAYLTNARDIATPGTQFPTPLKETSDTLTLAEYP